MEYVTLNNGMKMPQLGLGTYNMPGDEAAAKAVRTALQSGYRLIDTAHAYMVERGVGQGIKESGVPREEIFLTSKVWPTEFGEGKTLAAIDKMLTRLQIEYLDLLLIHQPFGDVVGAWKDMEKAVAQGKVRAIGLSNFEKYNYDKVMAAAAIKPALLQVECHPYSQQRVMRQKIAPEGMALECWYPLGGRGEGGIDILCADPVIRSIAAAHGKTPVQVILRWHIQEGFVAIPGSLNPEHIRENIDIFDFALTAEEMESIRALDKASRFFVAFESFSYEQSEAMLLSRALPD